MKSKSSVVMFAVAVASHSFAQSKLDPHSMPAMAQVDPRYLSYNVEAVEVTGGRFWKPFKAEGDAAKPAGAGPGSDPYQYRSPIDLSNAKLRKLAAALGPSFLRVSGTWRNSTFFQDDDRPALTTVPKGYKNVMTRAEWKGVVDFSHAVGADIVTSVSMSDGTRDSSGAWTPDQAKAVFDFTKHAGGTIYAAEFMNEPTFAAQGAAPAGYNAEAFAKDVKSFSTFLRVESPKTLLLGPGSIGEGVPFVDGMPLPKMLSSEEMLKDTGPVFDAFSYHFYTTLSERCVGKAGLSWDKVLTPAYLDRNPAAEKFYAGLRDAYTPGKPIWLTETGEAGCGGDRWASSFVDSFRSMDQLGALAQRNVKTVMVNTLASSDYGLLAEDTFEPRPNYWAALLWKRTMGTRVLDPGIASNASGRIYAHCMKGAQGGVSVLALNLDAHADLVLNLPVDAERYTLSAPSLLSKTVMLNGATLEAARDGSLPGLRAQTEKPGDLHLAPETITFIAMPRAGNRNCM